MALLWNPESWSQRLAELEARSGELKEAPLRRDVRSLGTLLGEVLREQAGEDLFAHVEALRQGTIRRRDAEARGKQDEAARHGAKALELVPYVPTGQYFSRTACRNDITGIIPGQFVFWNVRRNA